MGRPAKYPAEFRRETLALVKSSGAATWRTNRNQSRVPERAGEDDRVPDNAG
jgi:hypothetical protein